MSNQIQYKVAVKVEEANGLNIGIYLGATCEALVDALYTEPMYAACGKVAVTVKDIRLKDNEGRALPLPETVAAFIGAHDILDYVEDAIGLSDSIDGVKGRLVIQLSPDRQGITGLGVFSAGFWEQRLMAGLHLRITGQAISDVHPH